MLSFTKLFKLSIIALCLLVGACSDGPNSVKKDNEQDPDLVRKNKAQAELEAWADERVAFSRKYCKDKAVNCQKLMEEAGLEKPGKVNY